MIDDNEGKAEEKKHNKSIYEAQFGEKRFVDSLSAERAHKDYADRTVIEFNKVF